MDDKEIVSAKEVHKALNSWQDPTGTPQNLLASLLLAQERQASFSTQLTAGASPISRRATNEVLLAAIEVLESQAAKKALILRKRFIEGIDARGVANNLGYTSDTIYRKQREAIQALTAIINQQERRRRAAKAIELEADLQPATYHQLFGVAKQQEELYRRVLDDDGNGIIGVVGMGGLGKTALTDSVVRRVLAQFHFRRAIWARLEPDAANGRFPSPELAYEALLNKMSHALWPDETVTFSRQERLNRLRHQLARRPYLIIVDNLEDPADTAYIVAHLHDMTAPGKLLITSRARPQTSIPFYLLTLEELAEPDACALMRHHAQEKDIQFVASAAEEALHAVYQTVGGNPYALKLVVDLLDIWQLDDLLHHLSRGNDGSPMELYTHIYRQTWLSLSEDAKLLLQAMPLVANTGGSAAQLQRITRLEERFWTAVQELRHRSLIEVRGTLQEKRYGIHRLTHTFLATEINDWN